MKFELFQLGGTGMYATRIYDEQKMIPDPRFERSLSWPAQPVLGGGMRGPLEPKRGDVGVKGKPDFVAGETDAEFQARVDAYTQQTSDYEAQIEREATLLYQSEFGDLQQTVKVSKVIA